MKKALSFILALALCVVLISGPGMVQAAQKEYKIAFVPGITTDAFYISMSRGAKVAAVELGVDLIWQGPAQWDYSRQVPIVESLIAKKPDFLIIAPCDGDALIEPLKKVKRAGIPIITVDTNINDDTFYVSNITSDNYLGGKMAAEFFVKKFDGKGKFATLNNQPGITTTDARQKGFLEEIARHPGMEVVATQYCMDEQTKGASITENVILANPELKGIFAANVVSALGVMQGIKAKHKEGEIAVVAYDAPEDMVDDLANSHIEALVVQKPYEEGKLAVELAVKYLEGERNGIEKSILLPAVVATRDNMDEENVKKYFYTK